MPNITHISAEAAADIISEMHILDTNDLGPTIIHRGIHRHRGPIVVIANACGPCFLVKRSLTTAPAIAA